jgi:hypothetical protein
MVSPQPCCFGSLDCDYASETACTYLKRSESVSVLVSVVFSFSFAVLCDDARMESLEALDSQAIFVALRFGARCCGVLKMA